MSFLIYLLILFIFPYFSTGYEYGIIHNASIELPFPIPANLGHNSTVNDCNECLCDAFGNSTVDLFTCNQSISNKFICQFYYFMPTRDEIKYPSNDTDIYVMKENATFGEKDDCCNTTFLMNKITETVNKTNFFNKPLRSLAFNKKNNTFISIISNGLQKFITFDGSTLTSVSESNDSSFKTVGYNNGRYYLGKTDEEIYVYDETLNSPIYTIRLKQGQPLTIRFLDENQMLVGTTLGGYICERNNNTENFTSCRLIPGTNESTQVHAFGVVHESAFYVGWAGNAGYLRLYTKYQNGSWKTNASDDISYGSKTSDIFMDHNCQRIWIVEENTDKIIIYDQNQIKAQPDRLKMNSKPLFNLMIFENYTLVMSHENSDGLSRIQPSLNCRPPL